MICNSLWLFQPVDIQSPETNMIFLYLRYARDPVSQAAAVGTPAAIGVELHSVSG